MLTICLSFSNFYMFGTFVTVTHKFSSNLDTPKESRLGLFFENIFFGPHCTLNTPMMSFLHSKFLDLDLGGGIWGWG